ncbi:MAG: PAS domain S-box protein [Pseudomonadota bacterium]
MKQLIRVLYVDDSSLDRELVRDALEREHGGFRVFEAACREEFDARLEERDYDLVLSDFNILGFEGFQVLDAVQSRFPGVPVLIVTGTGSEAIAAEAIKRGAADYVIKTPQHIRRLPHTIQAVMEKHRLEEEHRVWEAQLKESEERFRAIFENAPQGLVIADEHGRFVSVNRVWEGMFGYTAEEARRLTYLDVTFADDADVSREKLEDLIGEKTSSYRVEKRFIRKNGSMFWADLSVQLFREPQSGLKRALGVVVEITKRKQAEESILRSEAKHRALLESAPIGIIVVDAQGNIREANQAVVNMLGSPSADATKAVNMLAFPPLVEAGIARNFARCLEESCRIDFEAPYTSKWGRETHLKFRLTPLTDPVDGSARCLGVMEDISDVRKAQGALEASENLMRVILDGISTNVAFVNKNLEMMWVNRAAADSLGKTPGDILGKKCHSCWANPDKPCEGCPSLKALSTRKPEWAEITTPDGRVWDERGEPVFDSEGRLLGVVEIAHDITARKRAERERLRSEERFKEIYDRAPVMMHSIDRGAIVRNVNDKWLTTMGYERSEVLGEKITSFMTPKTKEIFERFVGRFWRDRKAQNVNYQFIRRDGAVIHVLLDAGVIEDDTWGEISVSTVRDVTELRKTESALEESRRSFTNVVESSAEGIVVLDLAGTVLYGNRAAAGICGRERDHLPGLQLEIPQSTEDPFETEIVRPSGETRIVDMRASRTDWEGKQAYIMVMRDVTDVKERAAVHQRLVTAIEQSIESVVITDERGTILYVNPAFERVSGFSKEEAVGLNPRILKSGEHDTAFYAEMWSTLSEGRVWKGHFINRRKDGSLYEEDAAISPIKDDTGRVTSYVAVKRDVTDEVLLRKQLQKAQKMESIATMAGGIAHDFNNLLTIASGYTELLLMDRTEASPGYQELQAIAHAAQRGADLVRRILTFSRQVETFPTIIDLNEEVRHVHKLLTRTIPKMIDIELALAEDLELIKADAGQIEQTLLNLAVNAQHAMPDGGKLCIKTMNATLDADYCEAHVEAKPGGYVLLMVSDTGHGMEQDVLERIFEPFFSTKKKEQGTGLGLSMVFGIVKGHGGHITCYSEPGLGTTFKIYLPTGKRADIEPDVAATALGPAFGSETILLVDDEEMIRDLGTKILKQAGYTVLTANNGREALEIYEERGDEISLVILDMIMPRMGGKECLERLVALNPKIKVIIASGYSMTGPAREAMAGWSTSFVNKPFDVKKLRLTVRKVLDED